jgi:hypothetical protein
VDSFESVVACLIERDGFWTRSSVKVDLTSADKKLIGRESNPRWEIDIVAYRGKTNELWMVECKSYLDSGGVSISAFNGKNQVFGNRFKLFNEPKVYGIVKKRLLEKLVEKGFCPPKPNVSLVLAAGHIVEIHREKVSAKFKENGWILWDENELYVRLKKLADEGYENTIESVVSKMLLRRNE